MIGRTTGTLSVFMVGLAIAMAAPVEAQAGETGCSGDLEVQVGPYNNYGCKDCSGSIIVQVGHTNDVACRGDVCAGNIIIQAGVDNSVDCAEGLLFGQTSASAAAPPCPKELPEDNFYCHVLQEVLPGEMCLSLDFCLW